jgi:hypothetical protein
MPFTEIVKSFSKERLGGLDARGMSVNNFSKKDNLRDVEEAKRI